MGCDRDRAGFDPGPFFEGSPEPSLVLGAGGDVRALNAAFSAAFGWPRGAVLGRPIGEVLTGPGAAAVLARAAEGRGAAEADLRVPDGPPRPTAWRLAPGPEGSRLAVVRDAAEAARPGRGAACGSPGLPALPGEGPAALDPSGVDAHAAFAGEGAARFAEAAAALRERGVPFDLELEVAGAPGGTRWVRATGARAASGRLHGTVADVTAERARRRWLERLGAVARLTTNAILVTDARSRIEWCNRAFTEQTGYPAEAVLGRAPGFLDSPRNEPRVIAALMEAVAEGRPHRTELLNLRADGREIAVRLELQPLMEDGAIVGWMSLRGDVTEDRRRRERLMAAEREAERSRAQLMAAVEVLDDAFVLYDGRDRLVACNERYRALYEASAPAMVPGTRFEDILRYGLERGQYVDGVGREEAWLAERLAAHRAADSVLEQPLAGGRWLRVVERATPDGGRVGLRVDITRAKRQEAALRDALRRAEEASEAKSSFLATMSHEIRTPMNGILGLADLLAETALDADQGRLVGDLREAGESLLHILNDILDFSKIEAGRIALESIPFDPADLARRIEALHGPTARDKGLALRVEAPPGPARLGDSTRLLQVLGNLASNAIKFTEAGEVGLTIANPAEGALRIDVVDTGIGMSVEEAARVFDRFAQADSSVTRRFGGTGLGLSIVRGLVTAMGGQLEVWSVPGEGTRVGVTLALPAARRPRAAPGPAAPQADLAGVRILAADDNAMNRRVLTGMLTRLGAVHEVVSSGAEAVAAAREGAHDLLLLDISMPGMDGIEALAAIAAEAAEAGRAAPPAIAVTANVLEAQVAAYLAAGFAAHLPKPVRVPALAAAARDVLSRAAAA